MNSSKIGPKEKLQVPIPDIIQKLMTQLPTNQNTNCNIGDVQCSRSNSLTVSNTNTDASSFAKRSNDVCGMKFYNGGSVKRHMRIHTDESPYKCDV